MAKNTAAQVNTAPDRSASDSPRRTRITPLIIGLRTYRYTPATTRRRGGSHGASVPRPRVANCQTVVQINPNPAAITTAPTRIAARPSGVAAGHAPEPAGREETMR